MKTRGTAGLKYLFLPVLLFSLLLASITLSVSFKAAAAESEKTPVVVNPTPTPAPAPTPAPTPKPVQKTVEKKAVTLIQFDTKQLSIKNPNASVKWTSSDPGVCTVNNGGLIQAVGGGSCTITAVKETTKQTKKQTIKQIVTYKWPVKVTPLSLNITKLMLIRRRQGETLSLNNKNALHATSWSSSDSDVASVSKSGYVAPHSEGTAVITATWNDVTLSCTVQVKDATPETLSAFRSPKLAANQGKVILAGATLLDRWTDPYSAFGSTTVINNAVPNATFRNWNKWYKKLIAAYNPKAVVLCLGTDDIGAGPFISGEQAAAKMQNIIRKIHEKSKKTKIFYLALPLYPMNPTAWEATTTYNKLMKDYCKKKKYMTYLNLTPHLMAGAEPDDFFFKAPYTYLSSSGYDVLEDVVVKKVKKAAK